MIGQPIQPEGNGLLHPHAKQNIWSHYLLEQTASAISCHHADGENKWLWKIWLNVPGERQTDGSDGKRQTLHQSSDLSSQCLGCFLRPDFSRACRPACTDRLTCLWVSWGSRKREPRACLTKLLHHCCCFTGRNSAPHVAPTLRLWLCLLGVSLVAPCSSKFGLFLWTGHGRARQHPWPDLSPLEHHLYVLGVRSKPRDFLIELQKNLSRSRYEWLCDK